MSAFPYNDLDAKKFRGFVFFEHLKYLEYTKTLRLAFKVAFPGVRFKSFTLDNESEVYFKNFPQQKPALMYRCSTAAQGFSV